MTRRGPSPKAIALWRFSVIETLLDKNLSRHQHSRLVIRISRTPVRWPDGSDRRPGRATLYRWVALYSRKGFDGLKPQPRRDQGQKKAMLPESVVDAALHALLADPLQPWIFQCVILSKSQREAVQIQRFYQTHGPLPGQATAKAFQSIGRELGPGHALALYLDALAARLNQLNRRKDP